MFVEGDLVTYKSINGTICFVCEHSISILVRKGEHRVQDVKIVVYCSDFDQVFYQNQK